MRIPDYAQGSLSDYLEQRIDAIEALLIDKFGLEVDNSYVTELLDVRSYYRRSVDDMEQAVQIEYEDDEGNSLGQMSVYDVLPDEDDEEDDE